MGKLLEVIGKYKIKIISMASSNVSVSMILAASRDTLRIIQRELHKYVKMTTDENMSVIHVIGSLHWKHKQIESSIIETIKDIPISLIAYGSNDHCLTISVHTTDKTKSSVYYHNNFSGNFPLSRKQGKQHIPYSYRNPYGKTNGAVSVVIPTSIPKS